MVYQRNEAFLSFGDQLTKAYSLVRAGNCDFYGSPLRGVDGSVVVVDDKLAIKRFWTDDERDRINPASHREKTTALDQMGAYLKVRDILNDFSRSPLSSHLNDYGVPITMRVPEVYGVIEDQYLVMEAIPSYFQNWGDVGTYYQDLADPISKAVIWYVSKLNQYRRDAECLFGRDPHSDYYMRNSVAEIDPHSIKEMAEYLIGEELNLPPQADRFPGIVEPYFRSTNGDCLDFVLFQQFKRMQRGESLNCALAATAVGIQKHLFIDRSDAGIDMIFIDPIATSS